MLHETKQNLQYGTLKRKGLFIAQFPYMAFETLFWKCFIFYIKDVKKP